MTYKEEQEIRELIRRVLSEYNIIDRCAEDE
jgi:hypothetical protein